MIQVFHCKVTGDGQCQADVVDMHARIAFRVDREALAEILNDEARWRARGLSFDLVAEVEGDDLDRAFAATNHIDRDWSENPDVKVMTANQRRSTSVGDLVVREGVTFVVDRMGFTELPRLAAAEPAAGPEAEPEGAMRPRG